MTWTDEEARESVPTSLPASGEVEGRRHSPRRAWPGQVQFSAFNLAFNIARWHRYSAKWNYFRLNPSSLNISNVSTYLMPSPRQMFGIGTFHLMFELNTSCVTTMRPLCAAT